MDVVSGAFPRILVEMIGFIPVLIGFIIIGMTCFGMSYRFATIDMSIITLFSLLLGDSFDDITSDMISNGINKAIAIIYCITFSWTFIFAVHNIWIAIICEEV